MTDGDLSWYIVAPGWLEFLDAVEIQSLLKLT